MTPTGTQPTAPAPAIDQAHRHGGRRDRGVLVAWATALGIGTLTASAQGWLPDSIAALANSAGPWSAVAAAAGLTASGRRRAVIAATGAFWMLEVGYVIGAQALGHASSPRTVSFWLAAGLLAGPVIGMCAHELRRGSAAGAGVATGVLAGLLLGEALHGLTRIATTTSGAYWWAEIASAVVFLGGASTLRLRLARAIVVAVATTMVVATALVAAYGFV